MLAYKNKKMAWLGLGLLVLTVVLVIPYLVTAQDFGTGYLADTNLPDEDIRVVVVNIIRIALGALGIIFLGFIIYAGVLWLTAAGNQPRIVKAKKIITNAVIGLVIIVLAFAITTFVFNILSGSQNPPGTISCQAGETVDCRRCVGEAWQPDYSLPGCSLPGSAFRIKDIATAHSGLDDAQEVYLCSSTQAQLNNTIEQTTLAGNVRLTQAGAPIAGDVTASSRSVEFLPITPLQPLTSYVMRYSTALTDASGLPLSACDPFGCSLVGNDFTWNFTTGTENDEQPPLVISSNPIFVLSDPGYPDQNVDRDEVIKVRFSEAVRASTIDDGAGHPLGSNIILEQLTAQSGTVVTVLSPQLLEVETLTKGFDMYLTAPNLFEPFTWYRLTVQNISDLCGNEMPEPLTWEFQTNDKAPGIGGFYPTGNNICPEVGTFTVSFNTSMYYDRISLTVYQDNIGAAPVFTGDIEPYLTGSSIPGYNGTWTVDPATDYKVFNFYASSNLNTQTDYFVEIITNRVIDTQGNTLAVAASDWTFSVSDSASCTCAPYISAITPSQGLLGQCVTIKGQCFQGAVIDPLDPRHAAVSAITFNSTPSIVGGSGNNFVTTAIPNIFNQGDYLVPQVTITYNDPNYGSLGTNNSSVDFYVSSNSQAQGPCLLNIDPNSSCNAEPLDLIGLRFGPDPGGGSRSTSQHNVKFSDGIVQVPESQVTSWSEENISVVVPDVAGDGNVTVTASNNLSNPLPFDLACGLGAWCSDMPNVCAPNNSRCDPGLQCNNTTCLCESIVVPGAPQVIERWPTCSSSCPNAQLGAVFNMAMDASTISTAAVEVLPCTNNCNLANLGSSVSVNLSYNSSLWQLDIAPTTSLAASTSYRVLVHSSLSSSAGVALGNLNFDSTGDGLTDSYSWIFTTKATSCALVGVSVAPAAATADRVNQNISYFAYAEGTNVQCGNQALNPWLYDWQWASSQPIVATISNLDVNNDNLVDPSQSATVVGEGMTNIIPSSGGFSGLGLLTVDFLTCNEKTDCTKAGLCPGSVCEEATKTCTPVINSLAPATGPVGRWTTIAGCYFGSVQGGGSVTFDGVTANFPACGGGTWSNNEIIVEVPDVALGDRRVVVNSSRGLSSAAASFTVINQCLPGVPVPISGVPGICQISPAAGAVLSSVDISGTNFGLSADEVTFSGPSVRLPASIQAWSNPQIQAEVPAAAETGSVIAAVNSCPSNSVDYTVTSGLGTPCSTNFNQCRPSDTFCGSNTGLYCRPSDCTCQTAPVLNIVDFTDPSPALSCPNQILQVTFDQLVDESSVNGQTVFVQRQSSASCTTSGGQSWLNKFMRQVLSFLPSAWAQAVSNWCPEAGLSLSYRMVSVDFDGNGTQESRLDIIPQQQLATNSVYRVVIRGGSSGVKSIYGTELGGLSDENFAIADQTFLGFAWQISTTSNLCKIDKVEVEVSPPGAVRSYDYFTCAGQDSCADDQSSAPGNQHSWLAQAKDVQGNSLLATYYWAESDVDDIYNLNSTVIAAVEITSQAQSGQATFSVGAHDPSSAAVGAATSTVLVTTEICENPWPSLAAGYPYIDNDTGFSFHYCRGEGSDLLPALSIIPASSQDVLKELLLVYPPDANSADAIAVRVMANPQHLSARSWYNSHVPNPGGPATIELDGYPGLSDGRTTYVNAAHQGGSGFYTNIYFMSYSKDAGNQTVAIYKQLTDNWRFTLGVEDENICAADGLTYCSEDEDCAVVGGVCQIDGTKVRRDAERLTDLGEISELLRRYHSVCSNDSLRGCINDIQCVGDGICQANHGSYPSLESGTFIPGQSTSRWPSWSQTLGATLGASNLPLDPLNEFTSCPIGFDPESCWDKTNNNFACADGSHIYQYQVSGLGSGFNLYANMEYKNTTWRGATSLAVGSGNSCRSFSLSAGDTAMTEY
jgi:hypothetical protein